MMQSPLYLILENGMVFEGAPLGAKGEVTGEIVFTTGMTGYLETLSDQSYHGQIVLQTFPLIGNYGVIPSDFESDHIGPCAYIVKHPCQAPSNFRSEGTLDTFLSERGIVGLCGIDTRQLTRIIRENGVMNGKISATKPTDADIAALHEYRVCGAVEAVTTDKPQFFKATNPSTDSRFTVALIDYGLKHNIRRELLARGCDVWVLPASSTLRDITECGADGVMLSNGPGDPADNITIIENLREVLAAKLPVFGICLGHQLLALAAGFKTEKLKYGHRGANQPAKDLISGRVYITSQNHGYAVQSGSIDPGVASEWFINVNDRTCEGLIYKQAPAFSVQFHPEACGGPKDTGFLFDKFIGQMEENRHAAG